jgi:voltage-gated potassium channel
MQAVEGGGMMPVVLADHLTSQVEGICGVLAIYCNNDSDQVGSLCEGLIRLVKSAAGTTENVIDISSKKSNVHAVRGILEKAQRKQKLNLVPSKFPPDQRKGCSSRTFVTSGTSAAAASEEAYIQEEVSPIAATCAVEKADTSVSAQDSSAEVSLTPQRGKIVALRKPDPISKKHSRRALQMQAEMNERTLAKADGGSKAVVAKKAIGTQENRFVSHVREFRSRIHKFCTRTWMVVDGGSAFYWRWCLLVLGCVMFSSVVFPVLLGFGYETTGAGTFVVEFVFMVDLLISFHASYFDPKKCQQETDLVRIRHHYLHGWFAYDLLGSFPVQFIASAATASGGSCCSEHTLSTLKMLHLLKVLRVLSAVNGSLIQAVLRGNLAPSMVRLFKLLCIFFVILHWVACAYWAIVMTEGFRQTNGHDSNFWIPVRHPVSASLALSLTPYAIVSPLCIYTLQPEKYQFAPLYTRYAVAVHWATLALVGDNMKPSNETELTFTNFALLTGIGVFASVIGSASSLLSSLDAVAEKQKKQMDSISHYLTFHSVPTVLKNKIRDFYEYLWLSGQSSHDKNLFDQLPASLTLQLDLSLKRKLIEGVPMFGEISALAVLAIIRQLTHTIAIPEEIIVRQGEPGDSMYFLMRGLVTVYLELADGGKKQLTTMRDGAVFGEIALVQPDQPRTATISALHLFCEMQELSASNFNELLPLYPDIDNAMNTMVETRLKREAFKTAMDTKSVREYAPRDAPKDGNEDDIFSAMQKEGRSLTRNDTNKGLAALHESGIAREGGVAAAQARWKSARVKGQAVAKFTSKVAPLKPTEVSPQGGGTSDLDQ